jgi:hypothetical protein
MKYTVTINEKSKTVTVNLNGYEGVAKCCDTDTFNLQTGIELALERARQAQEKANAKPAKKMSVAEARAVLEDYVGDHIAVIGKGKSLSDKQKRELWNAAHSLAPELAPDYKGGCNCCGCDCDDDPCDDCDLVYSEDEMKRIKSDAYDEGYADGHSDGYDEGTAEANEIDEDDIIGAVANTIREFLS